MASRKYPLTVNSTSLLIQELQTGDTIIVPNLNELSVPMAANDIDLVTGSVFTKTITVNTTFTVSNIPASGTVASCILMLTNAGGYNISWGTGFGSSSPYKVYWQSGIAPTFTSSGIDIIGLYTIDNGAKWYGSVISRNALAV